MNERVESKNKVHSVGSYNGLFWRRVFQTIAGTGSLALTEENQNNETQSNKETRLSFNRRHITREQNRLALSLHKIIIIIIERKDLGGVMSKDCKDTLQTLKTVTKRECDAK